MPYIRYLLGAFTASFVGISPCAANAADMRTQAEQPFRQQVADLHDYLVALANRNLDAMPALDCGGLPLAVPRSRLQLVDEALRCPAPA